MFDTILPFFEGKSIRLSYDNFKICQDIASKLKFEPFQQVCSIFNKYISIVKEYQKIQELLSDINENNFESTKYQIIQSTFDKEQKYRNLLLNLIIYFSKIRSVKTAFYVKLIEALILNNKAQMNQLNSPRTPRQTTRPQVVNYENDYSNYIINDLKNEKLKKIFTPVFLYQIFKSSVIISNNQKKTILTIIKDSNNEELKEWFKPSFKLLNKEELDAFNKKAQKLNEEPIRELIRNDDISGLKSYLNSPNKFTSQYLDKHILNNTIVFDYYGQKSKPIYLTEYSAYFNSPNCFTWFVTNNFKSSPNLIYKAIEGGNMDIFNIASNNCRIDPKKAIRKSIKYHQNDFLKCFMDDPNYHFVSDSPETCIKFSNLQAFLRTEFSNFNFVFELIDYHNVVLIESFLPFLHSFNIFIMTFYSIVNQSNDIAKLLFESFDEIEYPLNYLRQLQTVQLKDITKFTFHSIVQSSQKEKFDKRVVALEFSLISDNLEFLKYIISRSLNVKETTFKSLLHFSKIQGIVLTKSLRFLLNLAFKSFSENQIFLLFDAFKLANQSHILLFIFEELTKAKVKLTNSQLDSILQILLQDSSCRSSILRNYTTIPIKTFLQNENDLNVYIEFLSIEKININVVLKIYLNKLCTKGVNTSNIRINEKEFIRLCTTHPNFKVDSELDDDKNSYLHYISMNKEIEYIYQFIFTYPSFKKIINKCNKYNKTPLITAIEHKNTKAAKILMEQNGISILNKDCDDMDAFDYAIQQNLIQIVVFILDQFGNDELLNGVSKNRRISPIACSETREMIDLLLSYGVSSKSVNGIDRNGKTLLVKSFLSEIDFDYKYILYNIPGIDLNAQCENGKTFLMEAIEQGQYNCIVDYIMKNPIPKIELPKSSFSNSQPLPSSSLSLKRNRSGATTPLAKSLLNTKPKIVTLSKSTSLNRTKSSLGQSTSPTRTKSSLGQSNSPNRTKSSLGQSTSLNRTKSSLSNQPLAPLDDSTSTEIAEQKVNTSILDSVDYKKCSKENSYLASAIIANDTNLVTKFLTMSIKEGNNQASLIAAMKCSKTLVPKLMKSKIELTPYQVVEEIPKIPEQFYPNILKQEKQPQKAFNSVFNDKTILMASVLNNQVELLKFLIANKEIMKLNFNWSNSDGMNCFDIAIQNQNKECVELLFNEPKLNKSFDSFVLVVLKKNKFTNSLKLDETIKSQWITEMLKKNKNELFELIVDNNNIELFNLIINDIHNEQMINQAFAKSISKRYEKIMNRLLEHKMLNPEFVIEKTIENNNVSLLKHLFQKYGKIVAFDRYVELVSNANQAIKDTFLNYAPITQYSKNIIQNNSDLSYNLQNVNDLINFV